MSEPDFDRIPAAASPEPPRTASSDGYFAGSQPVVISRVPHLRDYFKILYKRRWLVLPAFFIVSLVTAIETYSAVSIYGANAKLLIEVAEPKYVPFADPGDPA